MSLLLMVLPNSSSILRRTEPEPFFRTWLNCSYSPWISVRKCSVPLGRFRMDWRLMISVEAAAIFLYWCERVFRTFCSISLMKFTFLCYFTKRTDTMPRCKVSECEFSRISDSFVLLNTGTPTRTIRSADRLSQTSCLLHPVLQHFSRKCQHSATNIIAMASIHFVSS